MPAADAEPSAAKGAGPVPARALPTVILAALAALAFALSFPLTETFVAGWPLAFAWPALLAFAAWRAPSARTLAGATAAAFGLAYLAHQWWMAEVTALGMPVLVAYLAGWTALLALLVRALAGTAARPRWPFAAALPVALVAIEFLRGDLVCTGYAWFFAAHPLVEFPIVAQLASLGGGWLVSAFAAATAGGLVDAVVRPVRRARALALLAAIWAIALGWGAHRLATERALDDASASGRPALLAVQTDLPMSNKLAWEPEAQVRDFESFARLTIAGARAARDAGRRVDLALWPETTVPGLGLESEALATLVEGGYYPGDRYAEALRELARIVDAPLLVGSPAYLGLRVDAEARRFRWDRQFNSAYLVGPDGPRGRTDKIFLTPFGETMPIISNWDWLEQALLDLGANGMTFDLDAAERPERFEVAVAVAGEVDGDDHDDDGVDDRRGGDPTTDASTAAPPGAASAAPTATVAIGVPICFEITAPWASRRIAFDGGVRRAGVLANLSNDGWFAWSGAGRRQHLQVACLRAAELATPVVRSANTGLSAWIDANGRVRASLPSRTAATLLATPRPAEGVPPSAIVGDGVAWGALLAAVVGFAPLVRRRPDGSDRA